MRDSQSLLEQLLSFSGNEITADIVHAMLGTADESRLSSFALRMIERDAAGALLELDSAASEGVDVGQLAEQLLGYLRDMMAMSVGGHPDLIRTANPNSAKQLAEWGKSWGTMTLLSALQLLDETIVKMRHSVQSRVLLEVALVQICNLQDLQSLSELVRAFTSGQPTPAARPAPAKPLVAPAQPKAEPESKKKDELAQQVATAVPPSVAPVVPTIQEKAPNANQPPAPQPLAPQPIGNREPVSSPETANNEVVASQVPTLSVHESSTTSPAETLTARTASAHVEPVVSAPSQSIPDTSVSAQPSSNNSRQVENQVTSDAKTEPPAQPEEVASDDLSQFRFVAKNLGGFAEQCASMAVFVESISESQWKIGLSRDGGMVRDYFQTGENCRRLTQAIKKQMGRDIHLSFTVTDQINPNPEVAETPQASELVETAPAVTGPVIPQSQLIRNAMNDPLVKQFMDTFEGQIVRVDPGRAKVAAPHLLKNREATPEKIGERPTVHS